MRNIVLSVLLLIGVVSGFSQTPKDFALQLTASVQENPSQIILSWPSTNATNIKIYRKLDKNDPSFGNPIATISGTATQYVDDAVELGKEYEYRVEKGYSNYTANGYVLSGINVLPKEIRGQIILLVEASMATPLQEELMTLEKDLVGDGWTVVRHDVPASDTPPQVKNRIVQSYNAAPNEVKAAFIIGHVAVPYSGLIVPDGHPEHRGAWPADSYYGDMDGIWTDNTVNHTSSAEQRNHNVPGDGKYDQSNLPSDIELQVGRVDFHDLPVFGQNETELLRKYLNKNHAFRNKFFTATLRGLIDDNFGGGSSFYSSSSYRSFNVMFGAGNVHDRDYFSTMATDSYLWSHGNGPGFYDRARDVGTSQDFANIEVKSVFTTLFGSYHGDWDVQNNFMRSALASGDILTCAWSGRPQWQFHQMALGENIGLCAKNTNNAFEYEYTTHNTSSVHVGLMGDPTLRMHIIAPPSNLQLSENSGAELTWTASADDILGYYVYRRLKGAGSFERVSAEIITATSFTATNLPSGLYEFMVRAVKLETTPSGSYYNLSQGIFGEVQLGQTEPETLVADAGEDQILSCTISSVQLGGSSTTTNATYSWTTPDGQIDTATDQNSVTVSAPGTYTLTVSRPNSETVTDEVTVTEEVDVPELELGDDVTIQSGENTNIGIEAISGYTYEWSPIETLSEALVSDPIASPSETTVYTLMVTALNGCVAEDSITVFVEDTDEGMENEGENEEGETGGEGAIEMLDDIVIYPNPTSDMIRIESDGEVSAIAISDMTDKTVLRSTNKNIDVSRLRSGVYLLHFIINGRLVVKSFIKR